ncbi:hypothetical protein HYH03_014646 [Edaphochlamys debaryana]|uniref:Uncharacterized protein n=1 Tax=Edaphochlamys debaryana TaxID=47281 RepID=A0A836BTC6_9CHLO|nr:hypothetical protein HYH03_014646 [Edaphochlamys debaryana]|eukprot:KAG2486718.1 hypothetical protein HYH03_014646 [Edaphochlamys debaryana]
MPYGSSIPLLLIKLKEERQRSKATGQPPFSFAPSRPVPVLSNEILAGRTRLPRQKPKHVRARSPSAPPPPPPAPKVSERTERSERHERMVDGGSRKRAAGGQDQPGPGVRAKKEEPLGTLAVGPLLDEESSVRLNPGSGGGGSGSDVPTSATGAHGGPAGAGARDSWPTEASPACSSESPDQPHRSPSLPSPSREPLGLGLARGSPRVPTRTDALRPTAAASGGLDLLTLAAPAAAGPGSGALHPHVTLSLGGALLCTELDNATHRAPFDSLPPPRQSDPGFPALASGARALTLAGSKRGAAEAQTPPAPPHAPPPLVLPLPLLPAAAAAALAAAASTEPVRLGSPPADRDAEPVAAECNGAAPPPSPPLRLRPCKPTAEHGASQARSASAGVQHGDRGDHAQASLGGAPQPGLSRQQLHERSQILQLSQPQPQPQPRGGIASPSLPPASPRPQPPALLRQQPSAPEQGRPLPARAPRHDHEAQAQAQAQAHPRLGLSASLPAERTSPMLTNDSMELLVKRQASLPDWAQVAYVRQRAHQPPQDQRQARAQVQVQAQEQARERERGQGSAYAQLAHEPRRRQRAEEYEYDRDLAAAAAGGTALQPAQQAKRPRLHEPAATATPPSPPLTRRSLPPPPPAEQPEGSSGAASASALAGLAGLSEGDLIQLLLLQAIQARAAEEQQRAAERQRQQRVAAAAATALAALAAAQDQEERVAQALLAEAVRLTTAASAAPAARPPPLPLAPSKEVFAVRDVAALLALLTQSGHGQAAPQAPPAEGPWAGADAAAARRLQRPADGGSSLGSLGPARHAPERSSHPTLGLGGGANFARHDEATLPVVDDGRWAQQGPARSRADLAWPGPPAVRHRPDGAARGPDAWALGPPPPQQRRRLEDVVQSVEPLGRGAQGLAPGWGMVQAARGDVGMGGGTGAGLGLNPGSGRGPGSAGVVSLSPLPHHVRGRMYQ